MKYFFCRVLNVMDCRMKNKFPLLLGNEFLLLSLLVLSFTWAWWGRLITVMAKAVLQQAYLKTWGCLFHPATCTAQVCWAIFHQKDFLIENASLQNQNFSWRRLQFCQKKKKSNLPVGKSKWQLPGCSLWSLIMFCVFVFFFIEDKNWNQINQQKTNLRVLGNRSTQIYLYWVCCCHLTFIFVPVSLIYIIIS